MKTVVKINKEKDEKWIYEYLKDDCSLPKPEIVIAMLGSTADLKGKMSDKFEALKKGIQNAMKVEQYIWILTRGINSGIHKIVGEALKELRDEYSKNGEFEKSKTIISIGYAPAHMVAGSDLIPEIPSDLRPDTLRSETIRYPQKPLRYEVEKAEKAKAKTVNGENNFTA
jgi:hypothetical protein